MKTLKILSWNVNGLRAVLKKGFLDFLRAENPDILGIQETKIQPDQVPEAVRSPLGYETNWNFADRKGYSGTGVFYRTRPLSIKTQGFGSQVLEKEGRIIEMEYPDFHLFNIYFPNGQMSNERLRYKLEFYDRILEYFDQIKNQGKNLVIMGDFNTAHHPIDLKNPKENEDRSGFLPVERAWLDKLVSIGYRDTFRISHPEPERYTWWTYRFRAREKNIGWRIDYFFVNGDFVPRVRESFIRSDVYGSDHCPIGLELNPI